MFLLTSLLLGKQYPMSLLPIAPNIASDKACRTTSPSECEIVEYFMSISSLQIVTDGFLLLLIQCLSNPIPTKKLSMKPSCLQSRLPSRLSTYLPSRLPYAKSPTVIQKPSLKPNGNSMPNIARPSVTQPNNTIKKGIVVTIYSIF